MNLHEYQSKQLLSDYNIPTPNGYVISSLELVKKYIAEFENSAVIKAQVHTGGRGKAGGVKMVTSEIEAYNFAENLLGKNLVTHQTGSKGIKVNQILIEEASKIEREIYLSIIIDNTVSSPVIITSIEGGMDIEDVSKLMPEKIKTTICSPLLGISNYKIRQICKDLEIPENLKNEFSQIVLSLYKLFIKNDCTLIEINPLVITKDEKIIALDAKINIDDDAVFRHPSLKKLEDKSQMSPLEALTNKYDLSYVKLEKGKVGCMVNGAGLAMATMDLTKWAGAEPANFLDIGGSANEEKIIAAFKIIIEDKDVEIILVNLFAGIARADVVATGIVKASKETSSKIPLVVVMRGTNSEEGLSILNNSNLDIISASDLEHAAIILKEKISGGK
ncbi:MAG: ADP-forming succinate--CoA ligase subunit beta [Chloroflexi bacterium]|nr:ADP-forming succinate--CoA ligase subunit beta [Chloroflexota bacterium]